MILFSPYNKSLLLPDTSFFMTVFRCLRFQVISSLRVSVVVLQAWQRKILYVVTVSGENIASIFMECLVTTLMSNRLIRSIIVRYITCTLNRVSLNKRLVIADIDSSFLYLSTTPWRLIGEWRKTIAIYAPRHLSSMNGQL